MKAPSSESQTNQYGFYAIPKAVEPRKKYREEQNDEYSQGEEQQNQKFLPIQRQGVDEKLLERDYYVNEAPFPEFKPKQRGMDYGIQIEETQLFDYHIQVRPLLQILVGRSIISAINELQQEKQQEQRGQNLDRYDKKRNAELMVTQRMQAKSKRKAQEAERRKLQKTLYTQNRKKLEKKLMARGNGKKILRNLKEDIFNELDEQGFLKETRILQLKINYQGWLYEIVNQILKEKNKVQGEVQLMLRQEQSRRQNEHQRNINVEYQKRSKILNERQRVKKENEERKTKKRIRKQRMKLNEERNQRASFLEQFTQKYEPVQKMLKQTASMSNGLTKNCNNKPTLYISGGLFNFLMVLIDSLDPTPSYDQIQQIIVKILLQIDGKLEIQTSANHYQLIQEVKKTMEAEPFSFMTNKDSRIQQLANSISLYLTFIQQMGCRITSSLHTNILKVLLSIYLNIIPEAKEGQNYQPTEKDKKRQEIRTRVEFIFTNETESLDSRLTHVDSILRVHFQREQKEEEEEGGQKKEKQQTNEKDDLNNQDEWIDIFDGEGWVRRVNKNPIERNRAVQSPSSYVLTSFENSFVYDQRNLHFLRMQVQTLLKVQSGAKLQQYNEAMSHINLKIKNESKDPPIYDTEIFWAQ